MVEETELATQLKNQYSLANAEIKRTLIQV